MEWLLSEEITQLLLAMILGGAIGMEREIRDKAAGFRTLILISAGACLFTMFSVQLAGDKDPTRIAANIVTGIGFLGAGVIMRDGGQIKGLTTASTIWLVAALGMGVGSGNLVFSMVATLIFLVVLWFFPLLERLMSIIADVHTYRIKIVSNRREDLENIKQLWKEYGLKTFTYRTIKEDNYLILACSVTGKPKNQQRFIDAMLENDLVIEFSY